MKLDKCLDPSVNNLPRMLAFPSTCLQVNPPSRRPLHSH
jgi:hypothetical protein